MSFSERFLKEFAILILGILVHPFITFSKTKTFYNLSCASLDTGPGEQGPVPATRLLWRGTVLDCDVLTLLFSMVGRGSNWLVGLVTSLK